MALHHVAQRAGVVVVGGARADALLLGDGDLDVVDEARAPDGLEDGVGEAQDHQIFDGLLAEIMVDAKDLAFVEMAGQLAVDLDRAGEVAADRLFDDDAGEALVGIGRIDHAARAQSGRALVDEGRRNGEIEDVIAGAADFFIELLEALAQLGVVGRVGEGAGDEMEQRCEPGPGGFVELLARELFDAGAGELAIGVVVDMFHREADDREFLGEFRIDHQIVERGKELAVAEVAGSAENHEDAGNIGRLRMHRGEDVRWRQRAIDSADRTSLLVNL